MNCSSFMIKINFKNGDSYIYDYVIKFMTTYSNYLDCDTITLYFNKGRISFILENVKSIEVLGIND